MKHSFALPLLCIGALAIFAETGHAHGGIYRGPPDIVPPNPGSGRGGSGPGPGPTTPGPGNPTTPGPGSPSGPGPNGPPTAGPGPAPAGRPGPSTPRGGAPAVDLCAWHIWWEFNKDRYLLLKDAIWAQGPVSGSDEIYLGPNRKVDGRDSMAPTEQVKLEQILPALKRAIDGTENHDISSSCMVAMAKIGRDHRTFALRDVFLPRLQSRSQEIRETAAVSLGIAGVADAASFDLLTALATDSAAGREASRQPEVNDRTRAFATYGLGLLAAATPDVTAKQRALAALRQPLEDARSTSRNVRVASIGAIGLLRPDLDTEAGRALAADASACLRTFFDADLGVGNQLVQSHVPAAVAKLLGRHGGDDALRAEWTQRMLQELTGERDRRRSHDFARSAALALGQFSEPWDAADGASAAACATLLQQWHEHKDQQARAFAVLAVGQIGGKLARSALLVEFDKANKSVGKPWVAMALGVLAFDAIAKQRSDGGTPLVDGEIGGALQQALGEIRDPAALGSIAVALGMAHYRPAADTLRTLLRQHRSKDELAGYLCIGLALMGDDGARDDLRSLVAGSVRRPDLLKQAAIALGRLGDKGVADLLLAMLDDGSQNLASLSAVASALGFIGDARTVTPLVGMLQNDQLTHLTRAFAAVALGSIGDKESLPWNSKIAANTNYRAAVETLTDGGTGILDIL